MPPLPRSNPNDVRLLLRPNHRHRKPNRRPKRSRGVRRPSLPRASRMTRNEIGTSRSAKKKAASKKSSRFPRSDWARARAGARASAPRHSWSALLSVPVRNRFWYSTAFGFSDDAYGSRFRLPRDPSERRTVLIRSDLPSAFRPPTNSRWKVSSRTPESTIARVGAVVDMKPTVEHSCVRCSTDGGCMSA
jgi:hypothetical protein